ncbi:ParB/RepB/Spo0J family partition protein [Methylosinus sp. PW1]|uniref:ParB/RepB/Spo0J family partition protein n=1 Tax=Methylosinus sp. PW1 TaxID=107636 RepID=UPI00056A9050|nr:ParB/RepB/Spo0J family partition protein [Methylosinus sp. PW1]
MDTLPLHKIAGVSRFNARRDEPAAPEEIAELAASIREHGVIDRLLLRIEDGKTVALDGGRRFQALASLVEHGDIGVDCPVPCEIFEGSDEQAAEVSLISFLQRRDLHPVSEFEQFVRLHVSFFLDAEQIARKTGKSLRYVKDRLRLGHLSAKVRDYWRRGRIGAELARAFATASSPEQQDSELDELEEQCCGDFSLAEPEELLERLRGESVRETNYLAVFVGKEAYAAAGGALDEQLLEGHSWFLDGALLKRMAEEKLEGIGAAIVAAEGWGWACYEHKDAHRWNDANFAFDASDGDYTEEEIERLDAIEALPQAERQAAIDEIEQIGARAILRAISAEDRAEQGVYLSLSISTGRAIVERGVVYREAGVPRPSVAQPDEDAPPAATSRPLSAPRLETIASEPGAMPSLPEPPAKALRAVLDETMDKALADVTGRNVSLALVFLTAALGCRYGADTLDLSRGYGGKGSTIHYGKPRNDLLRKIKEQPFEQALYSCCAAQLDDPSLVPGALAELTGGFISSARSKDIDLPRLMIGVASRFSDISSALDRALDREAYFKAESKNHALAAITAIDGDASAIAASKLKKDDIVQCAALLAKDRHWLPDILADATRARPKDSRSTAQAMAEAIKADELREAEANEAEDEEIDDVRLLDEEEAEEAPFLANSGGDAQASSAPAHDAPGDRDPGERDDPARGQAEKDWTIRIGESSAHHSAPMLARFLSANVETVDGARLKASELREAYLAAQGEQVSINEIGMLLKTLGVEKQRQKDGIYYLGLALKPARAAAIAAE